MTISSCRGEGGRCGGLDTTNGAALEGLAWTQGIDDLEVRVVVPPVVSRGKQVRGERVKGVFLFFYYYILSMVVVGFLGEA